MKVMHVDIANFRGIKRASLEFSGHTLLLGTNNVSKSTVCEAWTSYSLRIGRFPPVEEFDFHNARYLDPQRAAAVPVEIEVTLIDLSEEVLNKCAPHLEHWHLDAKRPLGVGEAHLVDNPRVRDCLRIKAVASYNEEVE